MNNLFYIFEIIWMNNVYGKFLYYIKGIVQLLLLIVGFISDWFWNYSSHWPTSFLTWQQFTQPLWLNQVLQGQTDMPNPVCTFQHNLTQSITDNKSVLTFLNIINNCYRVNYSVTPIKRYGSEQPINPPFHKVVTINFSVAASKKVSSKCNIACVLLQKMMRSLLLNKPSRKCLW